MDWSNELVLMTEEKATERAVWQSLGGDSDCVGPVSCRDLNELASRLAHFPAQVAVVDVDPEPLQLIAGLAPLVKRFTNTRFVVLCLEWGNELLLEAMQVGARHCLLKSSLANDLHQVLRRLSQDNDAQKRAGWLVSVFSARGGCGATTIAVNLAEELHQEHGSPVLLVDMDLDYGAAASYLGIEHQYSLAQVFAQGEKIDPQLVSSTAATYHDGLHVIPSPATVNPAGERPVDFDHLERTMDACKQAYSFTVVDAPRASVECAVKLARASSVVFVVFELSVIDVRGARNLINELVAHGLRRETIVPVANRYKKRSPMLGLHDAQAAMGDTRIVTVRNDFENVIRSVNLGEPLAKIAPRSPARKDIRGLLENIDTGSASAA